MKYLECFITVCRCPVDETCRSRMNVPFHIGSKEGDEGLEKEFLAGASKRGMISLKGHRLVKQASCCCINAYLLLYFVVYYSEY